MLVINVMHTVGQIVGGGANGLATAYFLKNHFQRGLSVVIVEKDPTVRFAGPYVMYGINVAMET